MAIKIKNKSDDNIQKEHPIGIGNQANKKITTKLKINEENKNSDCHNISKKMIRDQRELEDELREFVGNDIASAEVEFNEFQEESYKAKYRNIMIKKNLIIFGSLATMIALVGLASYSIFSKKEMTPAEIASSVYQQSGDTLFNTYGVQNFISSNLNDVMKEQISSNAEIGDFSFEDVSIDNIFKKDNEIADVYFYVNLKTNKNTTKYYLMVPIKYDMLKAKYKFDSKPIFTSLDSSMGSKTPSNSTKYWKFDDNTQVDVDAAKLQESFVDNFWSMFYDGKDVSPFYKGAPIKQDPNQKYLGITDFKTYSKPNQAGYNTICTITLQLKDGLKYNTTKYMKIEKADKTFSIARTN